MSSATSTAWPRRAGLGRILYAAWHAPMGRVLQSLREGGPLEQRRTERGRAAMEDAAATLPRLNGQGEVELHVMTGTRFWYQTAFCLWTFAKQSGRLVKPVIYDDGTLSPVHVEAFRRMFPKTVVLTTDVVERRLDASLPATRFPALRARRLVYPHLRKLVDVHAGQSGWKLVVDSDLLFFRAPEMLVKWLDAPSAPLHAVDCETSYGYSRRLMNDLARRPVAERVNVGLTGLDSEDVDWPALERWCRDLVDAEGPHYYLEQALVAMLMAGRTCAVAPAGDYVTLPAAAEARACSAVMHHYVASSKRWYFQRNWRIAMERAAAL